MPPAKKPEDQREHHANENARDDRKVKDRAFTAIDYVAGQAAQRQIEAAGKEQHRAGNKDAGAENQ